MGAFVLLLGTALIGGVLWLATGGAFKKNYDLYLAVINESVAGLNLNAPVKYSGVDVGKVQKIQLDPLNPEKVRLIFAIEQGTPIKVDTVAVLKTQGLTGIAYVELGGSTKDAPPLLATGQEKYPEILTKPSLSTRLENILTTVLEKLNNTTSNIDSLLSNKNLQALQSTLADIAIVSHTIAARKDTINDGIENAARTFDNTARVTKEIAPLLTQIERNAKAIENTTLAIENTAKAIEKTGNAATKAINNADQTVNTVGTDVSRFSNEALPELQRLLGELNVLAGSLRRLSEQTQREPASLLRGRGATPKGPGE